MKKIFNLVVFIVLLFFGVNSVFAEENQPPVMCLSSYEFIFPENDQSKFFYVDDNNYYFVSCDPDEKQDEAKEKLKKGEIKLDDLKSMNIELSAFDKKTYNRLSELISNSTRTLFTLDPDYKIFEGDDQNPKTFDFNIVYTREVYNEKDERDVIDVNIYFKIVNGEYIEYVKDASTVKGDDDTIYYLFNEFIDYVGLGNINYKNINIIYSEDYYADSVTNLEYSKNGVYIAEEPSIQFKLNLFKVTREVNEDAKKFYDFVETVAADDKVEYVSCYSFDSCNMYAEGTTHIIVYEDADDEIIGIHDYFFLETSSEKRDKLRDSIKKAANVLVKGYVKHFKKDNKIYENFIKSDISRFTWDDNGLEFKEAEDEINFKFIFRMNLKDGISIPEVLEPVPETPEKPKEPAEKTPEHKCEIVDGVYYDPKGNKVSEKDYLSYCGAVDPVHSGYALPVISVIVLGLVGLILYKKKGKNIINKI